MLQEIKGFRVRTGKKDRDVCLMTSKDLGNYLEKHYESNKDEIVVTPIVDEGPATKGRYVKKETEMYRIILKDDKNGRMSLQVKDLRDINNILLIIYGNGNKNINIEVGAFNENEEDPWTF